MLLAPLLAKVRACTACAAFCPLGCKPLIQVGASARILIIGQAPGKKAHDSQTPWNDASGKRLRDWLGVSAAEFYDANLVALMPMGFCYPGSGTAGDLPPRPECAPLWHDRLRQAMPHIDLTILIGRFALERYASDLPGTTLTEQVSNYRSIAPQRFPVVHPSPRNGIWLKKNPWFEQDVIPELQAAVRRVTKTSR